MNAEMYEQLTERVRNELGESFNPLYIKRILGKNIPDLLRWISTNLENIQPTVKESVQIADALPENKLQEGPLPLGITLMEKNFRLALFVLNEVKARVNAIELST